MEEKRSEVRHDTYMAGRIALSGAQTCDCKIRDISAEGARLMLAEIGEPSAVPDEFDLLVLTTGELLKVSACWRRGRQIGVRFIEKDQLISWTSPLPA
jgi:hypothetical protein